MSLVFSKEGQNVAVIVDNPTYKNTIISKTTEDAEKSFKSFQLKTGTFQPIPDYNSERSVNFICGASGSGKSRYICEWGKQYKAKYKKNPIYVFSSLSKDESLEPLKPMRIILDEQFVKEPIDLKMYENSLCIFDDTDTIADKKIKERVYTLMNMILNTGRHHKISVFCVNHQPTGTKTETKVVLNEAHCITIFPANFNRQMLYLLENYCSVDKKEFKFLDSLGSRWITFYKTYPQCVVLQKHILMRSELNLLDEKAKNAFS